MNGIAEVNDGVFQEALSQHWEWAEELYNANGWPELSDEFWKDHTACERAIQSAISEGDFDRFNRVLLTLQQGMRKAFEQPNAFEQPAGKQIATNRPKNDPVTETSTSTSETKGIEKCRQQQSARQQTETRNSTSQQSLFRT